MAKGKNISVYLIDGEANGKIKAQISNWNGIAYKIPRELLSECKDFEAFKQSGVYFLFGYMNVYVGQAEVRKNGKGIHQRILDHEADKYKDTWDEVVIFTNKDNSLGRTDISYLENKFYNRALNAGRYKVQNAQEPTIGTVTEEKESELDEYIDQAELILGALGYKVFEPLSEVEKEIVLNTAATAQPAVLVKQVVPELPYEIEKVGEFIKTAMLNLQASGYVFSDEMMAKLLDGSESKKIFNLQSGDKVAFFKLYDENEEKPNLVDGRTRYYSPKPRGNEPGYIFVFGKYRVLLTKEWFGDNKGYKHRERFIEWYKSL